MANRYWVGGTGTWNTTSTTNWSASSGGASGASVPTAADSVFFDQAGTYTVTCTGALTCLDITVSAGTVTFVDGTTPTFAISGSMSLLAGTVWSSTGAITFSSTTTGRTVTTNGSTINGAISFNGAGGGWTLGSAITMGVTANISVIAGTFNTGNYNITTFTFVISGSSIRTVSLGSSTLTTTLGAGTSFNALTITNLTFNAGTSQINIGGGSQTLDSGGLTFYNVAFTGNNGGTKTITGANTFNNLSVTGSSSAGVTTVTFDSQQTINGTLSTTGTAGNRRVWFRSTTYGISVDLVVNSAPSLTDADFRGLYVRGTAAPISGTRIGNRGECRNITFSTPKTVYWNLAGSQNWSANGWAITSTGTPSTDNFPLPQDTATFTNAGAMATVTLDTAIGYVPNVDMSNRTSAATVAFSATQTVYGNWIFGTGITPSLATGTLTFSGGTTQTITSAGKTFTCPITVDTYGGTVQLADALTVPNTSNFTIANGTFNTAGYNFNCGFFLTSGTNPKTVSFGASAITTFGGITMGTNTMFSAGTSTITETTNGSATVNFGVVNPYNFVFAPSTINSSCTISSATTFNNFTVTNPSSGVGLSSVIFSNNQTINGTLTCAGASAVRRVFLRSDTIGTQRTITAAAISATDCDFRDINLAGAASGASPTRAGNCGGNSGITFPAQKTAYWNLAGAQNWSATGWATSSGGSPAANNFPLAQDTAVFDNAGSVTGTITIDASWNIGTFDASLRTSAMTLSRAAATSPFVYGNWLFGSGVTHTSGSGTFNFAKNGTQSITSNGVTFSTITVNHPSAIVQLADALSIPAGQTLLVTLGTFDAVTYNVTTPTFSASSGTTTKMGTGTWTLSGTGTVWTGAGTNIASTSTIVLSNTSTSARTFEGGGLYYNKLTVGGTTGTSTLTLSGNNTFGELASTKSVAHTITFPLAGQTTTIGKWSVTGTVGNVVTVNSALAGSAFNLSIAGPANSGIDYLSVRDCTVATTSPGEFYVGANSTNVSNNTRVIFTATPAPRTLYWRGGTGNWSATTSWDTVSGGTGPAAIPTSLDAVVFNSASNATAYTATIDAGVTLARCASFTMAGPLSGNVTFAGSVGIAFHGNVSFAATGITRTYTGTMNWAGNSSYTFTTNGLTLNSSCTIIGVDSTWTLGSAFNTGASIVTVTYGAFNTSTSNYALTAGVFQSTSNNIRSVTLNGSTLTLSGATAFSISTTTTTNLTFSAGTSTISLTSASTALNGGGLTFNNVSFTSAAATSITITGENTFNTLSFAGQTTVGINAVTFSANQTITTLTLNAGTASAFRTFLASNTLGTQRTLSVGTLTAGATDVDFRDIAITGAAAPLTGTRFGDAKGNSGITFPAAKTVYWRNSAGGNWGSTTIWSATNGGTADSTIFPLPQDTAVFPSSPTPYPSSGNSVTINANYNIGTIDMSARTANTMTLATGTTTPTIYGNWINGTGTTLTGTGTMTFAGRGSQTITSAGKTFTQGFTVNTPTGSVTLQDAFAISSLFSHLAGTFDASAYNFTSTSTASLSIGSTGALTRTLAFGSGTWTSAGQGSPAISIVATGLTVTGTGTISLTSAIAKSFFGGGVSYSGITLNQGGAGALTITGNNTFKTITNTYSATGATTIALGNTTQTLTNPWTATGTSGNVLTVSGTSAASPGTLIFSGSGTAANVDYLNISNVRAYDLVNEWYAGTNSTNSGSLGWYFVAAGGTVYAVTITETGTGTDAITARVTLVGTINETGTGTDSISAGLRYLGSISETGTGTDSISAKFAPSANITETATGSDAESAILAAISRINETATGTDTDAARLTARSNIAETATGTDADSARMTAQSSLSETATGTDADVGFISFPTNITETATGTDLDAAALTAASNINETASGTDTDAARLTAQSNIAETATGTDTVSALAALNAAIAEVSTISDLVAAAKAYFSAIVETAIASDADSARATFQAQLAETATAQDIIQGFMVAAVSISETATGTDQISALRALVAAVVEAATATDAVSAKAIFRGILLEVATLTDSVNAPGSTYNAPVVELAVLQDLVRAAATFPVSVTEAATGTQTNSAAFIPYANITESATVTDAASAVARFAARMAETATISDQTVVAPSVFNAITVATATALDNFNPAGSIYNAPVIETAVVLDSLIGGFLWNLIDDSQNSDWVNIIDSQAPNWQAISSAQTPGWTTISNPQSPGWTDIDDNQSPNWQNTNSLQ